MKVEIEIDDQMIIDRVADIISEKIASAFCGDHHAAFEDRRVARAVREEAIKTGRKCLDESKPYIIDRIIELSTKELCKKAYAAAADELTSRVLGGS